MLNEDTRKAIEIIVEEKAEARAAVSKMEDSPMLVVNVILGVMALVVLYWVVKVLLNRPG